MNDYEDSIYEMFGVKYGSPATLCSCGRTNFASDSDCMEEGELEDLQEKRNKEPNNYCVHLNCDSVLSVDFNGTKVFGCDCHWENVLGRILDQHQRAFLTYYQNKRLEEVKALKESQEQLKMLEEISP